MSHEKKKITSFTDLDAWQLSHVLVLSVYGMTKSFPSEESYALTSQLRRAAVSITSNIAEGFGRSSSSDRAHFYTIALGSLREVQSQTLIARDVDYISKKEFTKLADQTVTAQKILAGLIKSTKKGSYS